METSQIVDDQPKTNHLQHQLVRLIQVVSLVTMSLEKCRALSEVIMAFAISIQTDSSPIEAILKKLSDFDNYKDDLYVEIGGYGVTSTQERF